MSISKNYKVYTVPDSAENGYTCANEDYLGYRPYNPKTKKFGDYVFQSYGQIYQRASNFGSGLIKICEKIATNENKNVDFVFARNWPVAIYSINRVEWTVVDRALTTQSLYSVALYDTLGESSAEYILNHSEARVIVCSIDKIDKILKISDKLKHVKVIISMDDLNSDGIQKYPFYSHLTLSSIEVLKNWAKSKNILLTDVTTVEKIGATNKIPDFPPKSSDIYTILYTSGTTGNPKGVVSSHQNYTAAALTCYMKRGKLTKKASIVSYLPLAHCYDRNVENYILLFNGYIGYFSGDVERLLEDTNLLNPTIFTGVPRLLQRFYLTLSSKTIDAPGRLGDLSKRAFKEKLQNLLDGKGFEHSIWDPLIFNKTKAFLSKNVEVIITGSAPLEPHVNNFLRVALISVVADGYGSTETAAVATSQTSDDPSSGNSGVPYVGMEIRLKDVPNMGYLSSDKPNSRGEIMIRGPTVFKSYFKEPEKTNEVLSKDGWFATGDIGSFNQDGSLSVIDRKKSIFKLSQGEYVAPEKIENTLSKNNLVLQSFVHGYPIKSYLISIIVPDPVEFIPWAKGLPEVNKNETLQELCKNYNVRTAFLSEINKFCRASSLNGFEIPKAIYLEDKPFDVETNKLITPTFKLKRFDAAKYYKNTIDILYQ
ncbi:hypothetical protein BB561_002287 [Smittium simulii]|uniref:AMP-dependent synthetase/ligase domain-containing protein n=1 Tax=Smittium simulii TaxID=133385 RepID=A0A2T9YR18_9FUNG|nr:hypothetical protein BB561_002287 [Smittium simulii]